MAAWDRSRWTRQLKLRQPDRSDHGTLRLKATFQNLANVYGRSVRQCRLLLRPCRRRHRAVEASARPDGMYV